MIGTVGYQYGGGAEDDDFKKGGYKYQLSDDPPRDYIVTSQPTEDIPGDVNSDSQSSFIFESSVAERTYHHGIETRRDRINFDTGDKSKDPKSILWGKVR